MAVDADDFCVNYLWMRADAEAGHVIPGSLFRRLQDNAERYPHVPFHLWVEDVPAARDANKAYAWPANLTLHETAALDDDPAHHASGNIWQRVDMARLKILQTCLKKRGFKAAIYADFDIRDVLLESPALHKRLDTYGVAFGASFCVRDGRPTIVSFFENGFLASSRAGLPLLDNLAAFAARKVEAAQKEHFLKRLFSVAERDVVWRGMAEYMDGSRQVPKNWRLTVAGFPVQDPSGWRTDKGLQAKLA